MRPEEAKYIFSTISHLRIKKKICLNIGSSTFDFRSESKPHIEELLFRPMRQLGWEIIHTDIKEGYGIDISGDVFDLAFREKLSGIKASLTLCNNLLEHLDDYHLFAEMIKEIVPEKGGILIVSVPFSYPYHPDPIDNGYRPTPDELADLFRGFELQHGAVIKSSSYLQECLRKGELKSIIKNLIFIFFPLYKPKLWYARLDRFRWIFKPYTTTVVILEKS
jgi:hypothetical protein